MEKRKLRNKGVYYAIALLAILFLLVGISVSIIKEQRSSDWENILADKVYENEWRIQKSFDEKIARLRCDTERIKLLAKEKIAAGNGIFSMAANGEEPDGLSIRVFDYSGKLLYWRGPSAFDTLSFDPPYKTGTGFTKKGFRIFLTVADTFKSRAGKYFLFVSQPVETLARNLNDKLDQISFMNELSGMLSTSVEINYSEKSQKIIDGRKHSFTLVNELKNKIATATFDKPALDNDLKSIDGLSNTLQSILLLLIYILFSIPLYDYLKRTKKILVKYFLFSVYLIGLRVLLFLLQVPSSLIKNSLTDSSNFSSVFAFGMVSSPFEFFLTAVIGFAIVFTGFKYFMRGTINREPRKLSWAYYLAGTLIFYFLILLSWRGLGASLRSVVFDSTLRYFKDFTLIPSPPILMMNINILILGVSVILFAISLNGWVIKNIPVEGVNKKRIVLAFLFFILQILGWIFDEVQKQPQGTPQIRVIFLAGIFIISYAALHHSRKWSIYLLYGLLGSAITVSLLTYYNSEIERESLKTTAQEIARVNKNIYEFWIYQLISENRERADLAEAIKNSRNLDAEAFIIWSGSLLHRENVPSALFLFDARKNKIGELNFTDRTIQLDFEKMPAGEETLFYRQSGPFESGEIITGISAISVNGELAGYLAVSIEYNEQKIRKTGIPHFLLAPRAGLSSATDLNSLKIFIAGGEEEELAEGGFSINKEERARILGAQFNKYGEAWLKANIGGEDHLIFLLKRNDGRIIAVALENKKFTWNLSNFFKVFFVHAVIILSVFIIVSLFHVRKWKLFLASYRTKLAVAFIFVSVIPLVIVTFYIRELTEERNNELSNARLYELSQKVDLYLKTALPAASVNNKVLFGQSFAMLGINYSLFDPVKLEFSTKENLYRIGLLEPMVDFDVFSKCVGGGSQKYFKQKWLDRNLYNSVFVLSELNGKKYIIEVNDLFNQASLPLSFVEQDIFLFGVLSLTLILLIVFSTVLAAQISNPIRKLTLATRSVGSGDLNISIPETGKGEIGELTSGFNMMVKQIKKSQTELAQLEREAAWKEMAKQVAHEIKNPLTPMKLSIQQLIAAYNDKSPKFDSIFGKITSTIISQIEILKNIASEFSNFARMPRLNIERINLVDAVRSAVNLFADEKISVEFESEKNEFYVWADQDNISRTVVNLIRNSIQAAAKNVWIEIKSENGFCLLRVRDDGSGIEKENLEKIFDENFSTKSGGMGLGLSMAKKFIEIINGRIEVEKSSPEGTQFLIKLPVIE